ncbi:Isocitrate dehydrogenase [NADP] [Stylophora pistillata]|uniref:Isocitrate dehydrogenase [NADP] n=1 Tax=Stylophora pistillata TaxID=50429 RepID=A0A2B4R4P1_STYPI|nr:Isocitrate dehydrogenase [NADP] [Stylophora pistillata]
MKMTEGLMKKTFEDIAPEYPDIEAHHIIVDNCAHQMVMKPEQFEVIVTTNMNGDILSDLGSGLVGGLGFAPSANLGNDIAIFEAVHGSAPTIAGKNIANPTSIILSSVMMLRYLGELEAANKIEQALLVTLEQGHFTSDVPETKGHGLSTTDFTDKIISNLGQKSKTYPDRHGQPLKMPEKINELDMVRPNSRKIVGVDLFLESTLTSEELGKNLEALVEGTPMRLSVISNRGVKVYPNSEATPDLVDAWQCRFRHRDESTDVSDQEACDLLQRVGTKHPWSHIKKLFVLDGEEAYSKAQDACEHPLYKEESHMRKKIYVYTLFWAFSFIININSQSIASITEINNDDVLIIGAGPAGAYTALKLKEEYGLYSTILEASNQGGGKCISYKQYDHGAIQVPSYYKRMVGMTLNSIPFVGPYLSNSVDLITDGYQNLIENMLDDSQAEVLFNTHVERIFLSEEGIELHTNQGIVRAKNVISTVPLDKIQVTYPNQEECDLYQRLHDSLQYSPYGTTIFFPDIPLPQGMIVDLEARGLDPVMFGQKFPDRDVYISYAYGDIKDTEDIHNHLIRYLEDRYYIQDVNLLSHMAFPDYYPHPSIEAINNGFYADLQQLQGKYGLYFAGSSTSFEIVERALQSVEPVVQDMSTSQSQTRRLLIPVLIVSETCP